MTIASTARKAGPLLGNGAATTFPFTFKVFAEGDVKVVTAGADGVETVRVLGADYSVALNANQETSPGGTVTYPISGAPLATGSVLSLVGDVDYDQPLDLPSGGNFSPLALENQLDRATMQIQQLHEEMGRTAKLPVTSLVDADSLVADIVRIADSDDRIDTVAGSITGVNVVAGGIADVNTVASVAGAVAATGANIAAVVAVGNDLLEPVSEINTVATDIASVNTVGGNIASVNTVAGIAANVTTVATNAAAVNTVATNVADVTNFADVYQGAKAVNPALRNDGSALQAGDLYFNTVENALRAYSGTVWVAGTAGSVAVQNFSGDGVATAFTLNTAPASENNTQVYIGGVYQQKDQYSVSGTTLTFSSAPPVGTGNIEVVTLSSLSLGETDAALVAYRPAGAGAAQTNVQTALRNLSVPSAALLRGIARGTAPSVLVSGYYAAGDGGGGVYWYDASDTISADNGGTVIVAADGGRWKLVHQGEVSASQFGATGTANDTLAIQAALNAAGVSRITLLPGVIHNVTGVSVPSNKVFDFNGGTLKQISGTDNLPVVSVGDNITRVVNVQLLNVAIDGNKVNVTGNGASGVAIQKAQNVYVTSPRFESVRRVGLYAYDVIGLRVSGILTSTNGGVTGEALGNGVYCLACTAVTIDSISIATHSGVGGLFQGFTGLDIGFIEATGVAVDNGATFDTGRQLQLGGYKISGCQNQGLEINSTDGFEIGPGSAYNNGVYGILISTFTGAAELQAQNGRILAPYIYGNAVNGVRIIGAKNVEIKSPYVLDSMVVLNSAGGIIADNIDIIGGTVYALTLTSGKHITSKDTTITTLINSGVSYAARATKSGVSGLFLANAATFDLNVPTSGALPFSGILVVASYFSGGYGQNTTAAYLINTQGTVSVTSMTVSNGANARQVAVSVVDNKTLRLTNSTGVECLVNAAFVVAL